MSAQKPGQNASPLRLGIAGLGTVGTGTVKIIQKHAAMLSSRAGRPVAITAVSARDRMKNRDVDLSGYAWETDARALAVRDDIDVFVELIGGDEGIAREAVTAALKPIDDFIADLARQTDILHDPKSKPEAVAKVQPLVKWAAYVPPEQGTPKADELPTLYVAVVQDTSIPGDLATDTGIALANMTLAAWDKGVGSCIMGAINKPALTELLGIEEPQKLAFMVAFGYPTHKAHIVPLTAETGVKYYLDENRDYCVPKRSKEEIAKYL